MKLRTRRSILDRRARHLHQLGPNRRLLGDELDELLGRARLRDRYTYELTDAGLAAGLSDGTAPDPSV